PDRARLPRPDRLQPGDRGLRALEPADGRGVQPRARDRLTSARRRRRTGPDQRRNRGKERIGEMALEIKLLNLIDIELDSSFLVLARNMGVRVKAPTFGFLILGGEEPIMVDTGAQSTEIMHRLGMEGWISEEQVLETQLANFGLTPKDVRWVLHTHLH